MHSEHVYSYVYGWSSMALLKYLKANKDGLPDPKGSLSGTIPSRAIAQANWEVQQILSHENGGKRGPYKKYIYPCRTIVSCSQTTFSRRALSLAV